MQLNGYAIFNMILMKEAYHIITGFLWWESRVLGLLRAAFCGERVTWQQSSTPSQAHIKFGDRGQRLEGAKIDDSTQHDTIQIVRGCISDPHAIDGYLLVELTPPRTQLQQVCKLSHWGPSSSCGLGFFTTYFVAPVAVVGGTTRPHTMSSCCLPNPAGH
ncbi:hypothetical protein H4Q26_001588 [Puccinia striiformis f. sp. tritici PST-130]|uniref:Uncharacterized protein n=2 Tax=Puccinia striiformis TaxID=27350 RepID=A0A0L0V030_9BASI|nr:hypothetical protein H4Q26_001588 [Puccinia striiformis f. sp. tritici PST-130]KNE92640.1 hypothetical protein PSTG_13965 [Puccinia striiformis f. sp. tritici PST-78]